MVIRLLLFIYTNQQYTARWGNVTSNYFSVRNGVRQGGVSSGIFFVVYIDKLLKILRKSGFGCTIFGVFFGAVVYADDIFLLSASRSDLQIMINECQKFGAKMNLKFGTNPNPEKSKTKCLIFSKGRRKNDNIKKVELDGNELPWVQSVKHLGHTLQSNNSMTMDINMKRGSFISKVNSLIQEFHYASPDVMLRLV